MRKRIVGLRRAESSGKSDPKWLDLEEMATVEVTSENPEFPVESALGWKDGPGWRAAERGEQRIQIIFDKPVSLRRIQLRFHDDRCERQQEFVICWSPATGGQPREIVRQQWNFSPTGSTAEIEDYVVDLADVSALELTIQPDLNGGEAVASLASCRLGER